MESLLYPRGLNVPSHLIFDTYRSYRLTSTECVSLQIHDPAWTQPLHEMGLWYAVRPL